MASLLSPTPIFVFLLFLASAQAAAKEMMPVPVAASAAAPELLLQSNFVSETYRRKLGGFQICALCTCCGGPKGLCLPSPCCYAINCNIPNRPFGFCSFTPKSCNCLGCHL